MPIINNNSYPSILTWDWKGDFRDLPDRHRIQLKNNAPIFHLKEWSQTKNYWFIEFLHADAFYHFDLADIIPNDVLESIRNGNITLVLQNCHEGYHSIVEGIYQDIVVKYSINPKYILLISVSRDIDREVLTISEKYVQEKLQVEWFNIFEHNAKIEVQTSADTIKTLDHKVYHKKFLSFNGWWRPHRSLLMASLISNNLLDKGFVSYNTVEGFVIDSRDNFDFLLEFSKNNTEFLLMLVNNAKRIKEINQIFLDTQPGDSTNKNLASVQSVPLHMYADTYFSVVTETNFSTETYEERQSTFSGSTGIGRLLSEKTFKCIALKHPFILVTVPGTLRLLKELGYKTFGSVINESYDNEPDHVKRIMMITKEIDRLCNLSDSQLESFLSNCREICEHNYNLLINRSNYVYQIN